MKQGKGADWWAPDEDEDEVKAVDDAVAQARAALAEAESRKAELQAQRMAALRAAAEAKLKASEQAELRASCIEPRFTVKQSASSLTMLLHVAGVDKESVEARFDADLVEVTFVAPGGSDTDAA